MLDGKTLAFVLVMTSAFVHASWNVIARHLKGNFSILVMAHFFGALMSLPLVLLYGDFTNSILNQEMWYYVVPTVAFQAAYTAMLSAAYFYGDVGLVYPLARGTAIILATTVSQLFSIGVPLNRLEYLGIATVLLGIFVLAYDAYLNLQNNYQPVRNTEEGDVELSSTVRNPIAPSFPDDDALTETTTESNSASSNSSVDSVADSDRNDSTGTSNTAFRDEQARKITLSIAFAVCVGMCTASYSITDSFGVNVVPALTYSFILNILSAVIYVPYILMYKYDELMVAVCTQKKYLLVLGPAITGAYLIILFVFEIPNVNVALVVTLREFSVLIGTLLGVFVLKEQSSWVKLVAVSIICAGMALLKLG